MTFYKFKYFFASLCLYSLPFGQIEASEHVLNETAYVNTLNKYGVSWTQMAPVSEAFVKFSLESQGSNRVLDIGAAFGFVAKRLAEDGVHVVVNDLHEKHLDTLRTSVATHSYKDKIEYLPGRFPDVMEGRNDLFQAIHMAWVLHFMSGEEAEKAAAKMFEILKPGGKVFVSTASLHPGEWTGLEAEVKRRKERQEKYPGFFENTDQFPNVDEQGHFLDNWTHKGTRNAGPTFHFFEEPILKRLFAEAGFVDIQITQIERPSTNQSMQEPKYDLMLVASKDSKHR